VPSTTSAEAAIAANPRLLATDDNQARAIELPIRV
jgi:hypothetical protein